MTTLTTQLEQLENVQLVRRLPEEELAYLFKHALTQESAYESILLKRRREIHRRIAEAYEHLYPERLDEFAALLAQHFAEAGDDGKTLEYATRAGNQAARFYANAEALAHYTQALTLAQRRGDNSRQLIELYSRRGRMLELMGHHEQALENYDEMEKLALARGDRALELGALMARATILSTPTAQFNPTQAHELSERSLALARALNDRASEARIFWNLMLVAHFSSRYADAIAYGEQSIALARELHLQEQLAYSLNDIGRPYMANDQFEQSMQALREAQELWRALDNKTMLADNLNTQGTSVFFAGDYDHALVLFNEAYQLGQVMNNPWTQAHSLMTTSIIYLDRGEIERALPAMEECLRLARQVGFFVAEASMRASLALTYSGVGDLPRAFEFLEHTHSQDEPASVWEGGTLGILAQLYILQGNLDQARDLMRQSYQAMEHLPPAPTPNFSPVIAEAELALAEHDYERAAAIADKLRAMMARTIPPFYRVMWLYLKGRVLRGQGRLVEADQVLDQARGECARVGSRFYLWRILSLLAEIETQQGNPEKAAALYAQGREVVEFIAAHAPPQYRESFLNLVEVKRVMNHAAFPG